MSEAQLQLEDPKSVRTLLFVAAMSALSFVLGSFAIPVYPNVHFQFGEIAMYIVAVFNGPLYGFIAGFTMLLYTGLVIWGEVTVPIGWGLIGLVAALLSKKMPFFWAALVTQLIFGVPYRIVTEYFISGYPWELIWIIQIKSVSNTIVSALIAYGILKIPGIGKYIPISWDSVSARVMLEKGNL